MSGSNSNNRQRRRGSTSAASAARDQAARAAKAESRPARSDQGGGQSNLAQRAAQRDPSRRAQRVIAQQESAKRRRQMLLIGGAVGIALIVFAGLVWLNRDESGGNADEPVAIPASVEENTDLPKEGNVLGNADAPVTVIEWGDYQCPACGNFNRTTKQQLINDYISTGQVKFEYRDLPFLDDNASGDESNDSATAAYCAMEQDRFWDYHDTLFNNQIGENAGAFAESRLVRMAEELGLDVDAFESCMDSDAARDAVEAMTDEAGEQQVRSTPTFIINGSVVVGGNYTDIKAAIDNALGQ